MNRRLLPLAALAAALLAPPAAGAATPTVVREFPLGETPGQLTSDMAGNAWVVMSSGTDDIVKVDPAGRPTPYAIANVSAAKDIAVGPDGNLWVSQIGGVARFAPADPTRAEAYGLSAGFQAQGIVTGPDENIWAVGGDEAFQIAPATGRVIRGFIVPGMNARGIATAGGNLWIADFGGRLIQLTTAGTPTFFDTGGGLQEVTAGPDGQVGFTQQGASPNYLGVVQNGALAPPALVPGADPFGIVFAIDQAYWAAGAVSNTLLRLTPNGQLSTLSGFTAASRPEYLALGQSGTLWVTLRDARRLALVAGLEAPAPPPVTPPVDPPANPNPPTNPTPPVVPPPPGSQPVFANVSLTRTTTVGRAATLRLNVAGAASVSVKVQQKASGRTSRGRCAAPSRSNRRGRPCTRWVARGRALTAPVRNGAVSVTLSRRLAAGSYRVTVSASNAVGSATVSKPLTVKPKPRRASRRR